MLGYHTFCEIWYYLNYFVFFLQIDPSWCIGARTRFIFLLMSEFPGFHGTCGSTARFRKTGSVVGGASPRMKILVLIKMLDLRSYLSRLVIWSRLWHPAIKSNFRIILRFFLGDEFVNVRVVVGGGAVSRKKISLCFINIYPYLNTVVSP